MQTSASYLSLTNHFFGVYMPAPLIGLTTRSMPAPTSDLPMIASPRSYTDILMQTGAIPILIPLNLKPEHTRQLLSRLDGIIFTGGADIDPGRFNGIPHDKVYGIDQERDQSELSLLQQVREANLPLMGICRGIQLINVALGGNLYTHISDQLPNALQHDCFPDNPPGYLAHPVEIKAGSRLAQILGNTKVEVNSLHHQGIQALASELIPLAWAPDGLVEAVQVPGNPFGLAVQWHPEWLPEDPHSQALFSAFIKTARQHQANHQASRVGSELAA
jgi:putative glutamine amidotransferase